MNPERYEDFGMNNNGGINQNGKEYMQYETPQDPNLTTQGGQPTNQHPAQPESHDTTPMQPTGSSFPSRPPADLWRFGTKYEVKDDETFAFYDGYVVDYKNAEKKVQVVFENNWKAPHEVDVSYLRPVPPSFDPETWLPEQGERIECMAKAEEFEPSGWWGCKVACLKDGFYLIAFDGWDDSHNEILSKEMLRPFGGDSPFDPNTPLRCNFFQLDKKPDKRYKRDEDLDEELDKDFDKKLRDLNMRVEELHERIFKWAGQLPAPPEFAYIREQSGLLHLGYCPARRNCLVMIGQTASIQTAQLALQYCILLQKRWIVNEEGQRKYHDRTQQDINKYGNATRLEVTFPRFLTQFVIGRNGTNITKIRDEVGPELFDLKVLDNGKCLIIAETPEAADAAREKVEMVVRYVCVPSLAVREIIGPGGATISKLEEDSGVTFIQTEDRFMSRYNHQLDGPPNMPEKRDGETRMVIVGPRSDVETCVDMLKLLVEHLTKMREARKRNRDANAELNNLHGDRPYGYMEDDDDEYPAPGGYARPQSGGKRRRGNREFRPTSRGSDAPRNDHDGADGDQQADPEANDGQFDEFGDAYVDNSGGNFNPPDEDDVAVNEYRGTGNQYAQRTKRPSSAKMKYVVKKGSVGDVTKGQSSEDGAN